MATSSQKFTGPHAGLSSSDRSLVSNVIKQACARLGKCDQAMKDSVKRKVYAAAYEGERDYDKLLSIALSGFPVPRVAKTPPA